MAEYIEREAAFNAITDLAGKAPTRSAYEAVWKSARALKKIPTADVALPIVDAAPTADAEVVVRCKDCKHYDMGVCLKIYSDGNVHPEAWQPRRPEDYCSYGERKEE